MFYYTNDLFQFISVLFLILLFFLTFSFLFIELSLNVGFFREKQGGPYWWNQDSLPLQNTRVRREFLLVVVFQKRAA